MPYPGIFDMACGVVLVLLRAHLMCAFSRRPLDPTLAWTDARGDAAERAALHHPQQPEPSRKVRGAPGGKAAFFLPEQGQILTRYMTCTPTRLTTERTLFRQDMC